MTRSGTDRVSLSNADRIGLLASVVAVCSAVALATWTIRGEIEGVKSELSGVKAKQEMIIRELDK